MIGGVNRARGISKQLTALPDTGIDNLDAMRDDLADRWHRLADGFDRTQANIEFSNGTRLCHVSLF